MFEVVDTTYRKIHLVGSEIASLAAAAYLIRDGGIRGEDIVVYEEAKIRDKKSATDEIATKLCGHRCGSYLVSLACPVFPSDSWPISRLSGQLRRAQALVRTAGFPHTWQNILGFLRENWFRTATFSIFDRVG